MNISGPLTREQMIDEAVRRSMKRSTMKAIHNRGIGWTGSMFVHKGWREDDASWCLENLYPRRLEAIRVEFRRISEMGVRA